jgi:hypothetical protein
MEGFTMNRSLLHSLLWSAGMTFGATALAQGQGDCGVTSSVRADGSVLLSNTDNVVKCDPPGAKAPAAAPATPSKSPAPVADAPAAPAAAAPAAAASDANASSDGTDQAKDPRAQYRDAMLQAAPGTTGANPSVSRRYKMMDKETYQATVLGGVPPAAQTGSTGNSPPSQ